MAFCRRTFNSELRVVVVPVWVCGKGGILYPRCKDFAGDDAVIRILIADDNMMIRRGLRKLLETHDGWEVCGEASDGREAIQKTRELDPDVIVLDFLMPDLIGLEAAKEIAEISPKVPILLWSIYMSPELLDAARNARIAGILPKGNFQELFSGLETILSGGTFIAPVP